MSIASFLRQPDVALPITRPDDQDIIQFMDGEFAKFLHNIQTVPPSDKMTADVINQLSFIENQTKAITETYREYFSGSPQKAYSCLASFLNSNSGLFSQLYSVPIDPKYMSMFRLRTQDRGDFSREKMFHIPFDLRHLVKTQRYSIPGFPSLYTSSSLYIAWKELRCPVLDTVYAVRLEAPASLRVLDLGYTPLHTAASVDLYVKSGTNNQKLYDVVYPKILFWPLAAACSIRVLHEEAPFKPEYIIPQLLLQYVKENGKDIDGIRYFSMHYGQFEHNPRIACNFVFPVRSANPTGLCATLRSKFSMTDVMPWQIAQTFESPMNFTNVPDGEIQLVNGVPVLYRNTRFGIMESRFHTMQAKPI
jgi:hypothetical protein